MFKTTTKKIGKIDRMSFRIAFNEAIQPDKEYSINIDVSEAGYVPEDVDTTTDMGEESKIVLAKATGKNIEKLEDDPKVVRVQAPQRMFPR